ncbi:peroxiredoxin-like family protein [Caenispirillum bisanense]|uniref:peroxiredoxin-like family protein n=1 Tax=Caenispirillum bisanense TaxID=414052 RepID=UPI0031D1ABF1
MTVTPTQAVPPLDLPLSVGGRFTIAAQRPQSFTVVVFYRGLHCPICKTYLQQLAARWQDFTALGCKLVAVSCDDADRAERSRADWQLGDLPVAYGLTEEDARAWGLYLSRAIKDDEPPLFCEPALFLVRPDGTLYMASVASMPFARPPVDEVLSAIRFVTEKDYPPRGDA